MHRQSADRTDLVGPSSPPMATVLLWLMRGCQPGRGLAGVLFKKSLLFCGAMANARVLWVLAVLWAAVVGLATAAAPHGNIRSGESLSPQCGELTTPRALGVAARRRIKIRDPMMTLV
jgi:hypothetical protein